MADDHDTDDKSRKATDDAAEDGPQSDTPPYKRLRRTSDSDSSGGRKRSASPLEYGDAAGNVKASTDATNDPPLPDEEAPPLPDEPAPVDDGWEACYEENLQTWYFYNRITQVTQWENPREPGATATNYGSYDRYASNSAWGSANTPAVQASSATRRPAGGYNPAIHGNYDPNADYAKDAQKQEEEEEAQAQAAAAAAAGLPDPSGDDVATAHFNRFTGRFQHSSINADNYNDENKSRRQMSAFFDVDAAANSHDGRSLKAERRGQSISKKQLQQYKEKSRKKKEEKRRAWLRD